MTNELDAIRQSHTNCKSRLTKFKTFLDKCLNEPATVEEIQLCLKKIDECWKEYDRAQFGLETLAPNPNREAKRNEFEENYFTYTSIALKLINEITSKQQSRSEFEPQGGDVNQHLERIAQLEAELNIQRKNELVSLREFVVRSTTPRDETVVRNRHIPLPTLTLPTFSGGYGEWLSFRDSFSAIINDDQTIPKIQKLRYLRAYLGGEAAQVIENIETSSENYDEAWALLQEIYNNERVIIQNHIQAIFDLPNLNRESSACLRKFYDAILKHMRALKVLKEPTDSWDTQLAYFEIR